MAVSMLLLITYPVQNRGVGEIGCGEPGASTGLRRVGLAWARRIGSLQHGHKEASLED